MRLLVSLSPCLLVFLFGCTNKDASLLTASRDALEQKQFDQAVVKADEYLQKHPSEAGSAEALYLRGRALEARPAANAAEAASNLQAARTAYIQALAAKPDKKTETYIRTSLGNVAFFQDDYSTAIQQWGAAYEQLDRDDLKSWVLYRIGLSQQRVGQFMQADQSFAQVQQAFPGTVPAQRAKEHQGARQFFVQLATFRSKAGADSATNDIKKAGAPIVRLVDAKGYHLLRIGPYRTYIEAKQQRGRFADKYPDAVILP